MADGQSSIEAPTGDNRFSELAKFSQQRKKYQETLNAQERDFDKYREGLRVEQLQREKKLQQEIDARESLFVERESALAGC